ncbi:MAG: hypothetical protein PVF58_02135 [Candidatus Methanofastidiosia archaeon]|jgi:hypothetical protein
MHIPARDYTYESFNSKLKELSRRHLRSKQGKLGVNFFTTDVEDCDAVITLLENAGFEVEQQGEILFLTHEHTHYGKKMESVQYAYLYESNPLLVVFALKSMDYYNSPLVWTAEKGQELAHLKFFPKVFDELIERTLSFPDAQVVEFKGIKMDTFQSEGEKRPTIQRREIIYRAIDGEVALEELKYEYGVVPTQVTFFLPNKATFKVYDNGRFILTSGDYDFFRENIAEPTIESALQPVRDHKKAKLHLITVDNRTEIERISVQFTISDSYKYENFDDFLTTLGNAEFSPFNEMKRKGSIIFKSFLSDERSGTILSFYSNGKDFILSPKFGHGLHSLLRFYEFMLQEVDIKTEYVVK